MKIVSGAKGRVKPVEQLFIATFTQSEGVEEGRVIGDLVRDLLSNTPSGDLRTFYAYHADRIVGAAIFTRLTYRDDNQVVFLLSPMAVDADCQRQGIGQKLIQFALNQLRDEGVDIAITYGDPEYYKRVGFLPISQEQARPPLQLSMPHGWIGQSLSGSKTMSLAGPSFCVPALNKSDVW
ncbi:N-acetyltransferase [Erythrobacter sp. YJ-T3-07]|uniref:GNAT family N-acetyltransferase n=1 Tax=Erythrobacter sp. YJ-T3-07 TaxID=2793063 RepID=UPI0018D288CB|nr:N-acetyltransferase [Erythrobacter sp. YJ-T3-07]MBH1943501.1 N-acetyltransferase [Erythrobacter sp. YJ-T3-07]